MKCLEDQTYHFSLTVSTDVSGAVEPTKAHPFGHDADHEVHTHFGRVLGQSLLLALLVAILGAGVV